MDKTNTLQVQCVPWDMSRGPWDHRGKMKLIYLREARKVSQRKGCLAWVLKPRIGVSVVEKEGAFRSPAQQSSNCDIFPLLYNTRPIPPPESLRSICIFPFLPLLSGSKLPSLLSWLPKIAPKQKEAGKQGRTSWLAKKTLYVSKCNSGVAGGEGLPLVISQL